MLQIIIYSMIMMFYYLLVMLMIMVSVAFLTLMERKLLSYMQIRKGPNKVGFMGLIQPFSDAIKLLMKEYLFIYKVNFLYYYLSPMFMLVLVLLMWMIYPLNCNGFLKHNELLILMSFFSISVFGLLLTGWSSNSIYSMLGSIRSLAQSISYEVSLSIILISMMLMIDSYSFMNFYFYQEIWFFIYLWPMGLMFIFSLMAELNRAPFDFSEGESELVSGFNIEYGGVGFVMIFLSEYASIIFLSFLFNMFFMGGDFYNLVFYIKIMIMSFLIIWMRATFPRFRYDKLMYLCWKVILPFSLNFMFYIISFKYFLLI